MPIETHIHQARKRVTAEREAADAEVDAYDAFIDRVRDVPTAPTPSAPSGATATAGALSRGGSSTDDRCRAVRNAFAETVRPHSVDEDGADSLLETIRHELTASIAVALAPTTEPSFSPELKRVVVSVATTRRTESRVLCRALAREGGQLDSAAALVDDVTDWIDRADESPLRDLDFAALRQRHETLAGYRDRCDERAARRQEFLQGTTNQGVDVGVSHRQLVSSLSEGSPVEFPVLATMARLDAVCAQCQRAVRQHLVRRA
jgi:hypothetical protein